MPNPPQVAPAINSEADIVTPVEIDPSDLEKSEAAIRAKELEVIAKSEKNLTDTIAKNKKREEMYLTNIEDMKQTALKYQADYDKIFKDMGDTDKKVVEFMKNNNAIIKKLQEDTSKIKETFEKANKDYEAQLKKIQDDIDAETNKMEDLKKENISLEAEMAKIEALIKAEEAIQAILENNTAEEIPVIKNDKYPDMTTKEKCAKVLSANILKSNLYNFIETCKKLDSVPSWRALISTLIVGYLTEVLKNPSTNESVVVMPSYNYFNLVLVGTPGVGKSYTSQIIGEALRWSGFLTDGSLVSIKKPDIIGSYTGQTAPKVYLELTKALGKVAFIDEAYSIAGPMDESKKTFNEFGQEALDAITDYTSEHIGLFSIIAAGYQYEMDNQFLNVNIGLKRRFPSVLVLQRYDLKSFWNILKNLLDKFTQKDQVKTHNRACFELLNLMFNYQVKPPIKLSPNWKELWKGADLTNIIFNIYFEDLKFNVPVLRLSDFQTLLGDKNKRIDDETATLEIFNGSGLDSSKISRVTKTFIKLFILQNFSTSDDDKPLLNGDLFRSQADNLTKFSQTILEDKILNPLDKFKVSQDKEPIGNINWTQYLYFDLYFSKNPNQPINNMQYNIPSFPGSTGGSKNTKYKNTIKNRNKNKNNKNSIRNKDKNKNKKKSTRHQNKNKNKKHKNTIKNGKKYKMYGGLTPEEKLNNVGLKMLEYYKMKYPLPDGKTPTEYDRSLVNKINQDFLGGIYDSALDLADEQKLRQAIKNFNTSIEFNDPSNRSYKIQVSEFFPPSSASASEVLPPPSSVSPESVESAEQCFKENYAKYLRKLNPDEPDIPAKVEEKYNEMPHKTPEELANFVESLNDEYKQDKESIEKCFVKTYSDYLDTTGSNGSVPDVSDKDTEEMESMLEDLDKSPTSNNQPKAKSKEQKIYENQVRAYQQEQGDLTFKININFNNIVYDIEKIIINIQAFKKNDELVKKYKELLTFFVEKISQQGDPSINEEDNKKFIILINVYILLSTYYEALIQKEATKTDKKLNTNSWWFFDNADFETIEADLNIEQILGSIPDVLPGSVAGVVESVTDFLQPNTIQNA